MKPNDNNFNSQTNLVQTLARELVDRDKTVALPSEQGDAYLQIIYNKEKKEYDLTLQTTSNNVNITLTHFATSALHASRLYSLESALMKLADHYDLDRASLIVS